MIRLVVSDCDGVLTNGKLFYGPEGEILKVFNVKDGTAIKHLLAMGIRFGVVSGRKSDALLKRGEELGFDFCYMGIENKASVIQELKVKYGFSKTEVLYVGDDVNDCSVRNHVGVFCAVADADTNVLKIADVILPKKGGDGVLKEILNLII